MHWFVTLLLTILKIACSLVLLRYQIERGVIVIPKSVTKARIISNFNVFDFELTPEEMKTIDGFNRDFRFVLVPWSQSSKYYPFTDAV